MESDLPTKTSVKKVAFASFVGTAIEWYGFFLYNTAVLFGAFGSAFFPKTDRVSLFLGANLSYAVGFFGRPLGGFIFGSFGDQRGRKRAWFSTLTISGIATFLIGCLLPFNKINLLAPILLVTLRVAQGFGVGGEWGPAVLMAVEHAGDRRRGFFGSWPQAGVPAGLLLSTIAFAMIPQKILSTWWGWRIPFWLSIVLVGIGLYVRRSLPETPAYLAIEPERRSKTPIRDTIKQYRRNLLLGMGAKIAENATFYLFTAFIVSLAGADARKWNMQLYSRSQVLIPISIAAVFLVSGLLIFGWLSDLHRIGRKRVYLFGAIFTCTLAVPSFLMIQSGSAVLMSIAVIIVLVIGWGAMYAPQASLFAELFDTPVRSTGASVAQQTATIFAGAIAPILAALMLGKWHSTLPIGFYLMAMTVLTGICVYCLPETHQKSIYS